MMIKKDWYLKDSYRSSQERKGRLKFPTPYLIKSTEYNFTYLKVANIGSYFTHLIFKYLKEYYQNLHYYNVNKKIFFKNS